MRIGVIGGGKWGSALHFALSQNNDCLIYSRSKIGFDGFNSLQEVLSCEYLVYALPVQISRQWLKENFKSKCLGILVASKGIEVESGAFVNEIFSSYIDKDKLAFLSGPSFAAEVIKKLPTAVVVNSYNETLSKTFKNFFPNFIKCYVSDDIVGAEICGAYKNVLAIAGGICDGSNLGNNAKASLIARGLIEMTRFGKYFGAKDETFLGLSGAGDLFLTASSTLSRNYRVGLGLAKRISLEQILKDLGEVAEGVHTSRAIRKLAKAHKIYTPISDEVSLIIDGKDPRESIKDLLK